MLALAEELQNISVACKRAGISRSHYYEIKQAFEKFGAEGLAPAARRRPRMPNQTPPELEARILEMTTQYPTYGYIRISGQLKLIGVGVSPAAVRAVWQRHGLTLRLQRLLWLEQKTAAAGGVLTERQLRLLQRHRGRIADPEQHVEAPHSGYLLCQDTYFVGTIKGVGKIYMQSVAAANCTIPSSSTWPSTRSAIAAPRFAARKPTASANASTAPSRRSSSRWPSVKTCTSASTNCRPTSIGTSTSTTANAATRATAPRAAPLIKHFWMAALRAPLRRPSPELSSTGRNRADCLRFFR